MGSTQPTDAAQPLLSRVPYLPGLDGLRAIAVIAVMVYHADHHWLGGGFLGVEVFYVTSGYLITLLLIGEHEASGKVSLGQFWLRRARRLLPALFAMMAALSVYMALFNRRPQAQARGDIAGGVLYGSNWYQIWVGQGYTAAEAFVPLRHLWSLAVEEQFYLVWPLVMMLLLMRGRRHLPMVAVYLLGVSVAITVAMAVIYVGGDIPVECSPENMRGYRVAFGRCINVNETLYLSTLSRAGGLMLGAAFAMLWRPVAILRGPLRHKGRRLDLVALGGLTLLAILMWRITLSGDGAAFGQRFDPWLFRGGFMLTGIATVMVMAAVTHQGALAGRLLGNRPLRWVGQRSYGLYLYHWPIFQIIREFAGVGLTVTQFALAMLITVPITEASYRFIETPVRRGRLGQWWRGELRPRTARALHRHRRAAALGAVAAALVGFAGASIATADTVCVGQQACDNEVARAALASSTTTTSPVLAPPVTAPADAPIGTTPVAGAQTTTTTTTTIAPQLIAPVALGESVMLGAVPNLQAGGITVNADVSRQGITIATIAQQLRLGGQLGHTVIIQTGTNGSVSDETLDAIMQALPADQTPLVVFLTVKAPKGWIAGNNERIRALPTRYPNVKVIDWEQQAAAIEGELSRSDGGVHLSTALAKQFYANLIFDAIGRPDLVR